MTVVTPVAVTLSNTSVAGVAEVESAYVRALASGNGYGLVTTHDLELADLDQSIPGLTNCHFQETVAAGTLQFDYQLRPGPCPTTNALRIMELEGLPTNLPPPL